jgi:ribosomal-protein-alanine N-acetyltransferase
VQTVETCREFIESCNTDPSQHLFGLFLQEDDTHFGNAKIGAINRYHKTGQLSYFLGDKNHWRKGLAEEAQHALLKYGFEELGLERIEGGIIEENLPALRVALKNGFSVDGYLRKHMEVGDHRSGVFWVGILKDELPSR